MLRRKGISFRFAILTLGLLACVSGSLRHLPLSNELPTELPKEMKDRFEIKDLSGGGAFRNPGSTLAADPSAESAPRDQDQKKGKKKKDRKKRKKGTVAAAPPFVYPNRRPPKEPIWVGERLVYSISYLGMSAGDFTLEVLPHKVISSRKVYHIKGTAVTSSLFSLFYRLNDMVETFIDFNGVFSQRFHILLDETKQVRDSLELNDSEKSQTFYWNRWDRRQGGYEETKQFAPVPPFAQDSLSALYFVRTVPLTLGSTFSFPVISEAKSFEAVCTVVRKEKMVSPLGRVDTIVIQPEMKYQGILKKNGNSFLWVTDDDRRIPIRLEAKVRIGTVTANLVKAELGTLGDGAAAGLDLSPLPSPGPSWVPSPTPISKP